LHIAVTFWLKIVPPVSRMTPPQLVGSARGPESPQSARAVIDERRKPSPKKVGSNLFLDSKKASGSGLRPWSLLQEKHFSGGMVGLPGLEPRTKAL
jgi:hypothetical protein